LVGHTYDLKRKSVEVSSKSVAFNLFVQSRRYRNFSSKSPPHLPTTLVLTKILLSFEIISMLMKQRLSFVSTKTNKENEGNCIGKNNVIHFQKQLVATRAVEPEKTTLRKILDACSWNRSPKFEFRFHSPDSNYCEPCPWILSASFLSRLQIGQLKSSGISAGLIHLKTIAVFITHVQYLVESCSETYFVGNFRSNISLTFPKTSGKRSLHLIQTSDHR